MADLQPASSVAQELQEDSMALPNTKIPSSLSQPYKTCVRVDQEELLGSSTTSYSDKKFSSVSLPFPHPVFSVGTVEILAPFSSSSGGIPLRTFPSNATITFIAHASGVDLCAKQFEVIWQFKLFVQGTCSAAISERAKVDILTLGGTEEVPRRIVGGYTGEEHYLGWKEEHFKKFFDAYKRSSIMQAGDSVMCYDATIWKDLQMPKWLSAEELSGLPNSSVSALDRSLQESISLAKKQSTLPKKTFKHHRNFAAQAQNGKLSRSTRLQSGLFGNHRDRASKKGNFKLSSCKKQGLAVRPSDIYGKKAWYHGRQGTDHCKDRERHNQRNSFLPPTNIHLNKIHSPPKPIASLRDKTGLGTAISKTVKPYHYISARFHDKKPSTEKAPLIQSVRDFIAHKIEGQLLIPERKEAILHIIRTVSPREFDQRRNGRLIDYRNMSDRLYRQLAQLISDSSGSTADITTNPESCSTFIDDNASSAQALTLEMVRFTRENILKLAPERQKSLGFIVERTVPSVDALPQWARWGTHKLHPEDLPVESQIMIWKYLKMHLPNQGAIEIEAGEGDGNWERV
jgi:hypothetical protein